MFKTFKTFKPFKTLNCSKRSSGFRCSKRAGIEVKSRILILRIFVGNTTFST